MIGCGVFLQAESGRLPGAMSVRQLAFLVLHFCLSQDVGFILLSVETCFLSFWEHEERKMVHEGWIYMFFSSSVPRLLFQILMPEGGRGYLIPSEVGVYTRAHLLTHTVGTQLGK